MDFSFLWSSKAVKYRAPESHWSGIAYIDPVTSINSSMSTSVCHLENAFPLCFYHFVRFFEFLMFAFSIGGERR